MEQAAGNHDAESRPRTNRRKQRGQVRDAAKLAREHEWRGGVEDLSKRNEKVFALYRSRFDPLPPRTLSQRRSDAKLASIARGADATGVVAAAQIWRRAGKLAEGVARRLSEGDAEMGSVVAAVEAAAQRMGAGEGEGQAKSAQGRAAAGKRLRVALRRLCVQRRHERAWDARATVTRAKDNARLPLSQREYFDDPKPFDASTRAVEPRAIDGFVRTEDGRYHNAFYALQRAERVAIAAEERRAAVRARKGRQLDEVDEDEDESMALGSTRTPAPSEPSLSELPITTPVPGARSATEDDRDNPTKQPVDAAGSSSAAEQPVNAKGRKRPASSSRTRGGGGWMQRAQGVYAQRQPTPASEGDHKTRRLRPQSARARHHAQGSDAAASASSKHPSRTPARNTTSSRSQRLHHQTPDRTDTGNRRQSPRRPASARVTSERGQGGRQRRGQGLGLAGQFLPPAARRRTPHSPRTPVLSSRAFRSPLARAPVVRLTAPPSPLDASASPSASARAAGKAGRQGGQHTAGASPLPSEQSLSFESAASPPPLVGDTRPMLDVEQQEDDIVVAQEEEEEGGGGGATVVLGGGARLTLLARPTPVTQGGKKQQQQQQRRQPSRPPSSSPMDLSAAITGRSNGGSRHRRRRAAEGQSRDQHSPGKEAWDSRHAVSPGSRDNKLLPRSARDYFDRPRQLQRDGTSRLGSPLLQ